MSRVVVIGGHGKIALRLSRLLTQAGHEVTGWVRNPTHRSDVDATGARAEVHDVEQMSVDELAEFLGGHDAVVWSAGAGGGTPERTYAVDRDAATRSMDAAETVGVSRYVMVSYFGAGADHGVAQDNPFHAYAQAKAAADTHLRSTDLSWTILAPSSLVDGPGTGRIETGNGVQSSEVTRDDVAAVAAYVIEHPRTAGRTIAFNNGDTAIADALA